MKPLSLAMSEAAFVQYAIHANKIEIPELVAFSKVFLNSLNIMSTMFYLLFTCACL